MKYKKIINFKCPCCGCFTLNDREQNKFQTCPVCFWEDDSVQLDDPSYEGGANLVSLNKAKENYKKYGAVEERFKNRVRPPKEDEKE